MIKPHKNMAKIIRIWSQKNKKSQIYKSSSVVLILCLQRYYTCDTILVHTYQCSINSYYIL